MNLNLMNLEKPNDEIIIIRDSYICRLSFRSRLLLVPRGQFTTQLFLFLYLKKKKNRILMSEHMAGLGLCVMSLRLALFKNC